MRATYCRLAQVRVRYRELLTCQIAVLSQIETIFSYHRVLSRIYHFLVDILDNYFLARGRVSDLLLVLLCMQIRLLLVRDCIAILVGGLLLSLLLDLLVASRLVAI
jgi:hypothetical protein